MPVLCFGGSFNPIHHGHLICSRAVAEARSFQQVLLIPNFLPPHKASSADLAGADHRLQMCQLATKSSTLFQTCDVEVRRAGPSYTIDTVRALAAQGLGKVHWLIGADMLLDLPRWREPQALLQEVEFVVMARPGWTMDWDRLPPEFRRLQANVVEAPLIDISASAIRQRVAAGLSIDYLTPPAVCEYIRDHSLYR